MSRPELGRPYAIVDKKSGTVIDLSGRDNETITGYKYHGGDTQKWVLSQKDPVIWTIRSTYNDKFIGIEGAAFPGARAVGIHAEGPWNIVPIENDPEHFQISYLRTDLCLTLSYDGSSDDGTPVLLQPYWRRESQMWKFQDV